MHGRPAKPANPRPAAPADADAEVARAFADLADGAMSYAQAAEFCGDVCEETIEQAARARSKHSTTDAGCFASPQVCDCGWRRSWLPLGSRSGGRNSCRSTSGRGRA
jgi:hypothetical protein